jgi:hypothetical protein
MKTLTLGSFALALVVSTSGFARAASDDLTLRSSWLDGAVSGTDAGALATTSIGRNNSNMSAGTSSRGGTISPEGRSIGIGGQIGSPTAITMKFMVAGNQGIAAGIGGGFGGLSLHVDYLWHPGVIVGTDALSLSWYVGLGGWLGFFPIVPGFPGLGPFGPRNGVGYYNGHFGYVYLPDNYLWYAPSLAVRVPIGLSLAFHSLPIEIYGGLTPSLLLFPGFGFGMGGELGLRVYF